MIEPFVSTSWPPLFVSNRSVALPAKRKKEIARQPSLMLIQHVARRFKPVRTSKFVCIYKAAFVSSDDLPQRRKCFFVCGGMVLVSVDKDLWLDVGPAPTIPRLRSHCPVAT